MLSVNLKPKRTAAASSDFLATARLSCLLLFSHYYVYYDISLLLEITFCDAVEKVQTASDFTLRIYCQLDDQHGCGYILV